MSCWQTGWSSCVGFTNHLIKLLSSLSSPAFLICSALLSSLRTVTSQSSRSWAERLQEGNPESWDCRWWVRASLWSDKYFEQFTSLSRGWETVVVCSLLFHGDRSQVFLPLALMCKAVCANHFFLLTLSYCISAVKVVTAKTQNTVTHWEYFSEEIYREIFPVDRQWS